MVAGSNQSGIPRMECPSSFPWKAINKAHAVIRIFSPGNAMPHVTREALPA